MLTIEEQKMLESLSARKLKADALSEKEKIKWKHQIEDIENKINELEEKAAGGWSVCAAVQKLHDVCLFLNTTYKWDPDVTEFLNNNDYIGKDMRRILAMVDQAFKKGSMATLERALEVYKDCWLRFKDAYETKNINLKTILKDVEIDGEDIVNPFEENKKTDLGGNIWQLKEH